MSETYFAKVTIDISASLDKVWDALTIPEEIKKYLHGSTTKTDWVVGHPVTWSGEWNSKAYIDKGIVLAYEPKKLITTSHWSPLSGKEDKPENYHIITYELLSNNNQITLTLTQSNSPTQEDADNMIKNGWEPMRSRYKFFWFIS